MSERTKSLKELQNKAVPCFSAERALLYTEACQAHENERPVIQKAYALAHILENMTIYIQPGELIVGNHTDHPRCAPVYPEFSSEWILEQMDEFPRRKSDPLLISQEDRAALERVLPAWKGRSLDVILRDALPEKVKTAEECGILTVGNRDCATGHILPDYASLLKNGLNYYKDICEKNLEAGAGSQEQMDFWKAGCIVLRAAADFSGRYAVLAQKLADEEQDVLRKEELMEISRICSRIPENGAEGFQEAVQFVWFLHLIVTIESNGHGNSFGRFDQYINPYYEKDLAAGKITEEKACEILECFFIKTTDIIKLRDAFYSESFAGYPVWQNLIIGGQTADGQDATNAVSHLVLKANAAIQTSQPTVSVRYFDGLSRELVDEGVRMIQKGMATPAFFNDKLVVPIICNKFHVSEEVARDWAILGCVEPCIQGRTDGRPTVGYVNLLKCLELVMHNGWDPISKKQLGPKTGDFETFKSKDQLVEALYTQIRYFTDLMITGFNIVGKYHGEMAQMPFASLMISGCIKKGRSVQRGGADFSESGAFICGIGNTADAVCAIDTLVYQKKEISSGELLDALAENFEGKERLRQMLLNKAPKYGNDEPAVDGIAADIVRFFADCLKQYRDSRGGGFTEVVESQSLNVSQGKCVQASADGRFAFSPLNDNCSPVMGRDRKGPTACIHSVSSLNQKNAMDGCLYNIRFDPRSIEGAGGRLILEGIIKTYFDRLGEHIQINVVDDRTLRAAQKEPEKYRNLLVRVAGYLAYFTELDEDVQNNIIARTSHCPG